MGYSKDKMPDKSRRKPKKASNSVSERSIPTEDEKLKKAPHSFIFHRGKVGRCILSLIRDLRRVMEPYTAMRLKSGKKNVLKDFVAVAGPLGVTHLLTFSRTDEHIHMRVIRVPRGPTLTFRVQGYVLARDVVSSLKKPSGNQSQFRQHPLVVMNNFKYQTDDQEADGQDGRHVSLMQSTLQNMFPSININTVQLKNIRRCVLFNYDQETDKVECRHYTVKVAPTGLSRSAKKLLPNKRKIPDLGRYKDISEYFLTPGQLSESEYEGDGQNEVELPQDMPGQAGCERSAQAAVRLTELGPRLTLQLVKVETGIADGEVLYHKFIKKSAKEVTRMRKKLTEKRKLKETRRREQEQNVHRKRNRSANVSESPKKRKKVDGSTTNSTSNTGETRDTYPHHQPNQRKKKLKVISSKVRRIRS